MTPSLGLINLLELLTNLRETFSLLDHQFIIKGYNSGAAGWESCLGRGVGEGLRASLCLSEGTTCPKSLCAHQPEISLNSILGGSWRLYYIATMD